MQNITVIGGGLAGCEAALWLAGQGVQVTLYEQKPTRFSPAHKEAGLAELVCSNSLKAERLGSAGGLLKAEMRLLGSSLLPIADSCRVPAGGALAVNREEFTAAVTKLVEQSPNITLKREEATSLSPEGGITIVASGPLTEGALAGAIAAATGSSQLSFYDAAAPIVSTDSLDMARVFAQSRYDRGDDDYLNCPMNKEEYEAFYEALVNAEGAPLHAFDTPEVSSAAQNNDNCTQQKITVYEGCMPVEVLAKRGPDTLRFGPLKPVGLRDPNTGHRPWANLQLRKENAGGTLYNLVGFQTNLKFGEQKRVFGLIPGLARAEYVRYGVMHRNTFLNSPEVLADNLALKVSDSTHAMQPNGCLAPPAPASQAQSSRAGSAVSQGKASLGAQPPIFFAGQITGFEGYMESAACGLLAARAALAALQNKEYTQPPRDTMCGALAAYITSPNKDFQPMGANMGLLPPLETPIRDKRLRYEAIANRSLESMKEWLASSN